MRRTLKCRHLYVYNFKVFKRCHTPYFCFFSDHMNNVFSSHVGRESFGTWTQVRLEILKNIYSIQNIYIGDQWDFIIILNYFGGIWYVYFITIIVSVAQILRLTPLSFWCSFCDHGYFLFLAQNTMKCSRLIIYLPLHTWIPIYQETCQWGIMFGNHWLTVGNRMTSDWSLLPISERDNWTNGK